MFSKILVANRGIVSASCVQAIKELGAIAAIISLSQEKKGTVESMADEVYELDSPDPAKAYYDVETISALAKKIGADAVHPGYGFLAGNPAFEHALAPLGIQLIGLKQTGHYEQELATKPKTKAFAHKLGLQPIEGTKCYSNYHDIERVAKRLGYPLVIKPACGAAGRGMHIVTRENELAYAFDYALKRAQRFGAASNLFFLERYHYNARHIEIPVIRDDLGNIILFPEVESSIQRRFQKLLIESPSPIKDRDLIKQILLQSKRLVDRLELVGFASVEFLIENDQAFFLELNNCIQPSHLVISELTGVDIIKEQVRVFSGEELKLAQPEVFARGHSIGVFINAEAPQEDFAPSPGMLEQFELHSTTGVRVFSTMAAGDTVSALYDPIIAHVVGSDASREEAARKLSVALSSFVIEGTDSNVPFLRSLLSSTIFIKGKVDVSFLSDKEIMKRLFSGMSVDQEEDIAALIAAMTIHQDKNRQELIEAVAQTDQRSIWALTSRLLNRGKMEFRR